MPEQMSSSVTKLQKQISQQRDEIRSKNASLDERSQEIDAVRTAFKIAFFASIDHLRQLQSRPC